MTAEKQFHLPALIERRYSFPKGSQGSASVKPQTGAAALLEGLFLFVVKELRGLAAGHAVAAGLAPLDF